MQEVILNDIKINRQTSIFFKKSGLSLNSVARLDTGNIGLTVG